MKREILFRGFCPSKNGKQIITLDGKDIYGIHITDPKLYDKPKELGEFKGYCNKKERCYKDIVRHCNDMHLDWKCNSITRPPQSWQYIETPKWAKEDL